MSKFSRDLRHFVGDGINEGVDKIKHPPDDPPPPVVGKSHMEQQLDEQWARGAPKIEHQIPVSALGKILAWGWGYIPWRGRS